MAKKTFYVVSELEDSIRPIIKVTRPSDIGKGEKGSIYFLEGTWTSEIMEGIVKDPNPIEFLLLERNLKEIEEFIFNCSDTVKNSLDIWDGFLEPDPKYHYCIDNEEKSIHPLARYIGDVLDLFGTNFFKNKWVAIEESDNCYTAGLATKIEKINSISVCIYFSKVVQFKQYGTSQEYIYSDCEDSDNFIKGFHSVRVITEEEFNELHRKAYNSLKNPNK